MKRVSECTVASRKTCRHEGTGCLLMVQRETSNDCSPPATPESAIFGVFKLKPFADDTATIRTAIIDRTEHFMVGFDNDNGFVVSTTIFQILCDVSSS